MISLVAVDFTKEVNRKVFRVLSTPPKTLTMIFSPALATSSRLESEYRKVLVSFNQWTLFFRMLHQFVFPCSKR